MKTMFTSTGKQNVDYDLKAPSFSNTSEKQVWQWFGGGRRKKKKKSNETLNLCFKNG